MAFLFQLLDDGLDVLTRPCGDGGTQILVRESIETRCEDAIERVHHDLDSVLHRIVELFFFHLLILTSEFDLRLVFIALIHQIFEQGWNQSFAMFSTPENGLRRRDVCCITFSRLLWMRRINTRRIADVVADHDARIHALEIQNGNPWMQSCFNIVNVTSSDLTFLGFSTSCQWNGHVLAVGQSNDKTVEQLRGASIGSCFKRHFRNRSNRFLTTNRLNRMEDIERQSSISNTVFHDFIRSIGPFFVHVGGIDVDLLLVFLFWEQQPSNE